MPERQLDMCPELRSIVSDILKRHACGLTVWAFGSRAKGNAKTYSDLDLAVIADQPMNLAQSAALADAFAESELPWHVDIVDWASTSESFRRIIERDKVVLQTASCSE